MKESMIEELLTELRQVEEKNTRYKERNERLRSEQTGHIKELLVDARTQERELAKNEIVNREQVEDQMKEKWEFIRQKESLLEELRGFITGMEEQMEEAKSERDHWLEYKNVGSPEHAKQIHLLQEELNHMKDNFMEIDGHFRKNLEMAKAKIDKTTERKIDMTREMAKMDAWKHMNVESRKEMQENDWLKKEIAIYSKDVRELEETVYKTEQENLQLITHLFNSRLQDLKISRSVFLTQVVGLDLPEFLEDSLAKQALEMTSDSEGGDRRLTGAEDKESSEDTDEVDSVFPAHMQQLLHQDDKDFKEYLQLGPLELRLLSIEGQAMPIHKAGPETRNAELNGDPSSQDKWTITPRMIKSSFPP
ncbi:coiled-coil domain-containing protein 83 isoform X2 [Hyperolius riggenbachi]